MSTMSTSFSYTDEEGEEVEVRLPTKHEVCGGCEGHGTRVNPSIGAITASEWEEDWDEDSREGYMSGRYDVQCSECRGKRVVAVIDEDAARHSPHYARWLRHQEEEAQYEAMCRAERMMGA